MSGGFDEGPSAANWSDARQLWERVLTEEAGGDRETALGILVARVVLEQQEANERSRARGESGFPRSRDEM